MCKPVLTDKQWLSRFMAACFAAVVFAALLPQLALGAIAVRQSVFINAGTVSVSPSASFAASPLPSSVVAMVVFWNSESATATNSGFKCGVGTCAMTAVLKNQGSAGCWAVADYYAVVGATPAPKAWTGLLSSSSTYAIGLYEFTGVDLTHLPPAAGDIANSSHCAGNGTLHPAITSTTTGEMIIAAAVQEPTTSPVNISNPSPPWTMDISTGAFATTGLIGLAHLLYSRGGGGLQNAFWDTNGNVTNARANIWLLWPAATPPPVGSLPMMNCCRRR
jgi:hypothetical protein